MQALLDYFMSFVDRLWPWTDVDPWEEGLRVRTFPFFRQRTKRVSPGAVFTIPWFDSIHTVNVKRQLIDLPNQDVETSDRISMKVSGSMVYKITHPERIWLDTQDHDDALQLLAMEAIADWINNAQYSEVTIRNLREAVGPKVRAGAWKWGCEVEGIGITHLSKQRVYSITTG